MGKISLYLITAAMLIATATNVQNIRHMNNLREQGGQDPISIRESVMWVCGYDKCQVTGGYYRKEEFRTLWYKPGSGIIVDPKSFEEEGIENLVYDYVVRKGRVEPNDTSPKQIRDLNDL